MVSSLAMQSLQRTTAENANAVLRTAAGHVEEILAFLGASQAPAEVDPIDGVYRKFNDTDCHNSLVKFKAFKGVGIPVMWFSFERGSFAGYVPDKDAITAHGARKYPFVDAFKQLLDDNTAKKHSMSRPLLWCHSWTRRRFRRSRVASYCGLTVIWICSVCCNRRSCCCKHDLALIKILNSE